MNNCSQNQVSDYVSEPTEDKATCEKLKFVNESEKISPTDPVWCLEACSNACMIFVACIDSISLVALCQWIGLCVHDVQVRN